MSTTLRKVLTVMVGGACAIALALPAAATPRVGGEHKVTICHVTNSATNPYVVIEVDVAAFDGEGANDHTQHGDAEYEAGECQWDGGVVVVDDPPVSL